MMSPDAALCLHESDGAARLHFFKNRQVLCWDLASDAILPGYPQDIEKRWPGLLGCFPHAKLRGALHVPQWGSKVFFFFEGQGKLVVWDIAAGAVEPELIDSKRVLPCDLPDGEFTPVAARLPSGEPVVYAFHRLDFVRWTIGPVLPPAPDAGFPRKIAEDWKDGLILAPRTGVYVDWPNRSSAHSNKKIYFFMGDLYLRWDVPSNSRNYRLDIIAGWKGWPAFA